MNRENKIYPTLLYSKCLSNEIETKKKHTPNTDSYDIYEIIALRLGTRKLNNP